MKSSATQYHKKNKIIKDNEKFKNGFCLASMVQSSLKQLAREQQVSYRIATCILQRIETLKKCITLFVAIAKKNA